MRALWQKHGKPGGKAPGYVDNPYTVADLKAALAAVAGDAAFADDFFARFIQGRELVDYAPLLDRVGLVLRPASPNVASAGRPANSGCAGTEPGSPDRSRLDPRHTARASNVTM